MITWQYYRQGWQISKRGQLPAWLCLTFFLLSAVAGEEPTKEPAELGALRLQYEVKLEERVNAPYKAARDGLEEHFGTALDRAAEKAKKDGNLDEVLAIQDEKKRLAEGLPIPDSDEEGTPQSLRKLRNIYHEQLEKITGQRATRQAELLAPHLDALKRLETELTVADRIRDAKQVRSYRTSLGAGGAMAATTPAKADNAKGVGDPKAARSRGDDLEAAELILSIGGLVMVTGGSRMIERPEDLPKGDFTLRGIEIRGWAKRKLEESDSDTLANLREIEWLNADGGIGSDGALRCISSWPKLRSIDVSNCRLGGGWLRHAAPLENLERIKAIGAASGELHGLESFRSKGIVFLELRGTAADDRALAAIGKFAKLEGLRLRGTRITDAGMSKIAGLKRLSTLVVTDTEVGLPGMEAIAHLPLARLGFGKTPADLGAAAGELAEHFPRVETIYFPSGNAVAAEHIAGVGRAWPRLKHLRFPSYQKFEADAFADAPIYFPRVETLYLWHTGVSDTHVPGIAGMKKLQELDLSATKITDTSLKALERMRGLKRIDLGGTGISKEGLAAFEIEHPDVKVEK